MVWQQLMHEGRSRLDACTHQVGAATRRWFAHGFASAVPAYFGREPGLAALRRCHACASTRTRGCPFPRDVRGKQEPHLARSRATPAMRTDRFRPDSHWRKSGQWFMLNRK